MTKEEFKELQLQQQQSGKPLKSRAAHIHSLMKLLHAEDGGMVMYVKRLEAGRFKLPQYDEQSKTYPMEWRDLVVMVEGMPCEHAF